MITIINQSRIIGTIFGYDHQGGIIRALVHIIKPKYKALGEYFGLIMRTSALIMSQGGYNQNELKIILDWFSR